MRKFVLINIANASIVLLMPYSLFIPLICVPMICTFILSIALEYGKEYPKITNGLSVFFIGGMIHAIKICIFLFDSIPPSPIAFAILFLAINGCISMYVLANCYALYMIKSYLRNMKV